LSHRAAADFPAILHGESFDGFVPQLVHSRHFHGPHYQKMAEDLHLTGKAQLTVHQEIRDYALGLDFCT
jgi:hypothetical protein